MRFRTVACVFLLSALATPALGERAPAPYRIEFGQGDSLAIDQPRVTYYLQHSGTGEIHGPTQADDDEFLGLPLFNQALLDTGANGVVLGTRAYIDMNILDINAGRYSIETRPDGSSVQYEEVGVAGTEWFDLLEPYDITFAGFGPDPVAESIEQVRPIGNPGLDFGGFSAIIGMPAMMDRRTTVELETLLDYDEQYYASLPYLDVSFDTLPEPITTAEGPEAPDSHYQVDFRMWMPPHSDPEQEGDPTPSFTPMPFVDDVALISGENRATGSFLFDTGAQISIISQDMAESLGIDLDDPELEHLDVGGVGGSVSVPLVPLDRLDLPALKLADNRNVDLQLDDLHVAVLDIGTDLLDEPLEGILGMNILTSGYADPVLGALFGGLDLNHIGEMDPDDFDWEDMDDFLLDMLEDLFEQLPDGSYELIGGYFDRFHLDFASGPTDHDATGRMLLEVNDSFNTVVPEPTAGLTLAALSTLLLRRRR